MTASPASLYALSFAAGAAVTAIPLLFRLNAAMRQSADWERRATIWTQNWQREDCALSEAEAKLTAIHTQHVEAGKRAQAAAKALRDARTEDLRLCIAARKAKSSCGASAAPENGRIGSLEPRTCRQDAGAGTLTRRERRPHSVNSGAEAASENRAVESVPAEFSTEGA